LFKQLKDFTRKGRIKKLEMNLMGYKI